LIAVSYLIGAIPTAIIIGKVFCNTDVRQHGSGSAGATNTWRVLGWKAGIIVLTLDVGKGVVTTTLVPMLPLGSGGLPPELVAILCGLAAVTGHVFPIYAGFRGGKGVATAAGMLAAIAPISVGIAASVFGITLVLFRRVSLGSIIGALTIPLSLVLINRYTAIHHHALLIWLGIVLCMFILFTHRGNILRLVRGEERALPWTQNSKRTEKRK
jgi:glycerol-3-phosphate acyltransferase PlsY